MPYVQSHTSLRLHPKLSRLRAALLARGAAPEHVTRPALVGYLHLLWHWTLEYAPWGNLSPFSPAELADAAEWPGEAATWVEALVDSGWLTRSPATSPQGKQLAVHDWLDYAGEMLRKRQQRQQARPPAPPTSNRTNGTVPRATVPPTPPAPPTPAARPTPQEPAGFAGIRALRQAAATQVTNSTAKD